MDNTSKVPLLEIRCITVTLDQIMTRAQQIHQEWWYKHEQPLIQSTNPERDLQNHWDQVVMSDPVVLDFFIHHP